MDLIERLHSKGLIKPPPFVIGATQYLTIMGSQAYGVSNDSSDLDIYGFCVPPKDMIFPHLKGEILGFGNQIQRFEQFQEHHIVEKDHAKQYDFNIYSIVKYFQLVLENNPNMIDSLFTDQTCVLKSTKISDHVRDNRKLFLHKGCWHRFKGYAYQQMHKMKIKNPDPTSKRYASVMEHGYDVKFAYHVVRLLNEVEQILIEGDLDLRRNNDQLKAIRRGEWSMQQIEQYFVDKEKGLEKAYLESTLAKYPNEPVIKQILLECLEERFGSLEGVLQTEDHYQEYLASDPEIGGEGMIKMPAKEDIFEELRKDLMRMAPDINDDLYDALRYSLGIDYGMIKHDFNWLPMIDPYGSPDKKSEAKECDHKWAQYNGFSDSYEYCTKCDRKKI